jgi:hypothetical protein
VTTLPEQVLVMSICVVRSLLRSSSSSEQQQLTPVFNGVSKGGAAVQNGKGRELSTFKLEATFCVCVNALKATAAQRNY